MLENKVVLHYWDGRGRAEIIRLVMATIGIEWCEQNLNYAEDMDKLKSENKLLFGQVPLLEIDGKNLVQSGAIVRYLASKQPSLFGNSTDDRVNVDMLYEGTRDFLNSSWMSYGFNGYDEVRETVKSKWLPKYLPLFERALVANGSNGHLVGTQITLADIGLLEVLLWCEELCAQDEFNAYPQLRKFLKLIREENKQLSDYLLSERRPRINDEAYIASVRRTLRW